MKIAIRDPELVGAVRPRDVVAYLRATGWTTSEEEPGKYSIWVPVGDGPDADVQVLLPLTRDLRDYSLRIGEVLRALSDLEDRAAEAVLTDVNHAAADVVRIRLDGTEAASGEVPLSEGADLVSGSKDLLFAAACAAVQRRRYFHTRRPPEAVDYMEGKVRLGQTERGSFIVTLISELPLAAAAQLSLHPDMDELPFERRVTTTLQNALSAAVSAADRSVVTGDLEPFVEAVESGVSANLCAAIATTVAAAPTAALDVALTWAISRPPEAADIGQPIRFTPDAIEVVGEAAKALRSSGPFEDFQLFGPVERLERPEGENVGTVTIATLVLERPARVRVVLDDHEYTKAIHAHDEQLPALITGTLVRSGRQWELQDPGALAVVDQGDDGAENA